MTALPAAAAAADLWRPRVLDYIDDHSTQIVRSLSELIRIPSVSGTDAENSIQAHMANQFTDLGLDIDHWQIPLTQTMAAPDFPGAEVERTEAWGLVGAAHGTGDGPSLMLNVHVDVVPPGDLGAWQGLSPFTGTVQREAVIGRGACDMKGGVIAAFWAVKALTELRVPLRGDLLLSSVQGEEDGGLGTYASLARGW